MVWGSTALGGVLLSGRARALDQVSVGSDGTFRLPWILRHLGPARLSLSAARLEGARAVPHSFIVGYRLNLKPTPSVELGLSALVHSGGEGSPAASFRQRLVDHLILIEGVTETSGLEISNKFVEGDVQWRIPGTRGSRAYLSVALDDLGKPDQLGRVFGQDGSYVVGMAIPRLEAEGRIGIKAEYHETGVRFYRHGQFASGLTTDGIILGDGLGPDGRGGYIAVVVRPNVSDRVVIQVAREERSNDFYAIEANFRLSKVIDLPEETRTRLLVDWERNWPNRNLGGVVRVGYERVSNFGFTGGAVRDGALVEIRTVLWLHR
jgi:hypothetical protein